MAADCGSINHVSLVIGEPEVSQRFQQTVPNTLLRPTEKPDIDRALFPVAFMYISPRENNTQDMQHAVQITTVILRRAGLSTPL